MNSTQDTKSQTDILSVGYEALLRHLMTRTKKPHAYAKAICKALYSDLITDFADIPDLPPQITQLLQRDYTLHVPEVLAQSNDTTGQTRKDLIAMDDGSQIEVVMLRYRQRYSLCISSQVGCACGCIFCATGQMGFVRQLSSGEIISQITHAQRVLAQTQNRAENIVLMGMGEPLLNYDAVVNALHIMVDGRTLRFAPRHITVSTAGIAPRIIDLATDAPPVKLAISLHAATDELRNQLMPLNARYPLDVLFEAIRSYTAQTRRRVMLEWTMIDGINDTPAQAHALGSLAKGLPVHVNFIPLNSTAVFAGQPSHISRIEAFGAILDANGIPHTMRQRRGNAITSGCGQLRSRKLKSNSREE